MQERNYAIRAGSAGPSATAYIDRDGSIVRAIDPVQDPDDRRRPNSGHGRGLERRPSAAAQEHVDPCEDQLEP